ncbi:hypothetical protein E3J49_03230 [Candidatus Bathyarchaeota archaeon]|nr:MAG: hypothetical protein E3J49_03230 [Candidatus Bathyarchaeota archaeon]
MGKMISENLLTLIEEILNQEKRAKELYEKYLETIKDQPIVEGLARILNDEKEHIRLASEVLGLIKHGPSYSRVRIGLDEFSETSSILISCGIESYLKVNLIVLKKLVNEKGLKCIYVAINKPVSSLIEAFKREDIQTGKLFFIECSTVNSGAEKRILAKLDNLTNLNMSISRLIEDTSGRKFVYLDAISALYIFNPANVVERFAHHLIASTKSKRIELVLVAVNEEIDKRSMVALTTFCDGKIEV